MGSSQHVLFIDLHGVLVQTPVIFEKYKEITVDHLMDNFQLSREEATKRYESSMKKWETAAFNYLRDPTKKKVGVQFLEFLDECDALFPSLLYEGLEGMDTCRDVRSRPFEFSVASQVRALYPEVKETLDRLQDLNYRMYVASSSHSSHILGILEANDIGSYFAASVNQGATDMGYQYKKEDFAELPEELAVVPDEPVDVAAESASVPDEL